MRVRIAIASALICVSALTAGAQSRMYLAGPFNYYGMNGFSDKWELSSTDNTLYTGTFNIPEDKLIFDIVEYFDDDTYKIFGSSAREGSRVYIALEEIDGLFTTQVQYAGQGDWCVEDWPGGEVTFSIDFAQAPPKVTMTTLINPETGEPADSGIEAIPSEGRNDTYYNLQGIPVSKEEMTPGIYINNNHKFIKH